jgi:hypothetical protein
MGDTGKSSGAANARAGNSTTEAPKTSSNQKAAPAKHAVRCPNGRFIPKKRSR